MSRHAALKVISSVGIIIVLTIMLSRYVGKADTSDSIVIIPKNSIGIATDGYDGFISASGHLVAFYSRDQLIPEEETELNYSDVYVYNRFTDSYSQISHGTYSAVEPTLSYSGRYIAYSSILTRTTPTSPTIEYGLFWGNTLTKNTRLLFISRQSIDNPLISGDGSVIAFESRDSDLVANDTNGVEDIFVYSVYNSTILRVSVGSSEEEGIKPSYAPSVSYDGRYIAFGSYSTFHQQDNPNELLSRIYIRDTLNQSTLLVSTNNQSVEADHVSAFPSLSYNGRYVAFQSAADNLASIDQDGYEDVFVKDLLTNDTIFASNITTDSGHKFVTPKISADGRYVVFTEIGIGVSPESIYVYGMSDNSLKKITSEFVQYPSISGDGSTVTYWGYNVHIDPWCQLGCSQNENNVDVVAVMLEQQNVLNGNWEPLPEVNGALETVDGNLIRIAARLKNNGSILQYPVLDFRLGVSDTVVSTGSDILPANETKDIYTEWNSNGYAWNENGTPQINPLSVKVTISNGNQSLESSNFSIKILPKPVILVHGWRSSANAWSDYVGDSGSLRKLNPELSGLAVDTIQTGGASGDYLTIDDNAVKLKTFIANVMRQMNASHVDIVAHSMGGLIARQYIHSEMPLDTKNNPIVNQLLMLGTPNLGSTCALRFYAPNYAYELTPDAMTVFNEDVFDTHGLQYAVLAGNNFLETCRNPQYQNLSGRGDYWVSVVSAIFNVSDNGYRTHSKHTDLTSAEDFDSFVKPRLVVSPSGKRPLLPVGEKTELISPSEKPQPSKVNMLETQIIHDEKIELPPGAGSTISIPVPSATQIGISIIVSQSISSMLFDPNGSIVWSVPAETPETSEGIRSYHADEPVAGNWQLKLLNQGQASETVYASTWADGTSLVVDMDFQELENSDQVNIVAKITDNGEPITNGIVTVDVLRMDGALKQSLVLHDDGSHRDGKAGDGLFGNATSALPDGRYIANLKAQLSNAVRMVTSAFRVRSSTQNSQSIYLPIVAR